MGIHELLHHIFFLLFLTCGHPHCLLLLIEHHLLHCLPGFGVQVTKLAVLWLYLLRVDALLLAANLVPPAHSVHLLKVQLQLFSVIDVPETVLNSNFLVKIVVDEGFQAARRFQNDLEAGLPDIHDKISCLCPCRNWDGVSDVLQSLHPGVTALIAVTVATIWNQTFSFILFYFLQLGFLSVSLALLRRQTRNDLLLSLLGIYLELLIQGAQTRVDDLFHNVLAGLGSPVYLLCLREETFLDTSALPCFPSVYFDQFPKTLLHALHEKQVRRFPKLVKNFRHHFNWVALANF
mmetsp:Transcript_6271/g.21510  ORF Transcript_6271/g.21510 Transcript_6271/m.21510 type:complete len:292 (-) Transcript_6271:110-985(-)